MDVHNGGHPGDGFLADAQPQLVCPRLSRTRNGSASRELHAEKNRATQENYMPGSIFKTVVGMAALEAGLNPEEIIDVEPNPAQPNKGYMKVGNHAFRDLAAPGDYNFRRALKRSSNSYFITIGLRIGPERLSAWASGCISANARDCPPARIPPAFSPAWSASGPAGPTAIPATCASAKTRYG